MDEIAPGALARRVMRASDRAALATLADGGTPYASLVLTALDQDGTPILLISRLARHTRNAESDPRVSLLFDGTAGHADPLTGPRVTVMGRLQPGSEQRQPDRYLARHPSAGQYAGFGDFAFHAMEIGQAHLVAGFGRIHRICATDLLAPADVAGRLAAAEPALLQMVNDGDGTLATRLAAARGCSGVSGWRAAGIDCDGADFRAGDTTMRLHFPRAATSAEEAAAMLRQPDDMVPA